MISRNFLAAALAALVSQVSGAGVTGSAEGFAKGVTGGGSATAVYPTTNAELVSYLGDSSARVIILTKTFDFTGTEGTSTETGCAPWGTGSACQTAINQNSWCDNYEASAPDVTVSYDKAGVLGITVGSNKSLVGQGSAGVIKVSILSATKTTQELTHTLRAKVFASSAHPMSSSKTLRSRI